MKTRGKFLLAWFLWLNGWRQRRTDMGWRWFKTFAPVSPRMTGENRGQTPGGQQAATGAISHAALPATAITEQLRLR